MAFSMIKSIRMGESLNASPPASRPAGTLSLSDPNEHVAQDYANESEQ